jgi:membrane protein implicated in regulation of membrane protease activity|tara:strand:- start:125 stop:409 length:285 start_codon:yes stop_codon:yes gene_type:complete
MSIFLNYWLYFYQIWLIAAVIFLFIELSDGSLVVFLPIGLAAALVSVFILASNDSLISDWYLLLLIWSLFSGAISFLLSKFWKKGIQNKDINEL